MLARVRRGATTAEDAHADLDDRERTGLAEYGSTAGNAGQRFAGSDPERDPERDAERPGVDPADDPADDRCLVARDERMAHGEVVFRAPA